MHAHGTVGLSEQSNSYQSTLTCLCFESPTEELASQYVCFLQRDGMVQKDYFFSLTLRHKGIFYLRRKFTFDDNDLSDEDPKTELDEEQRLEALTKELVKVAKRQTSIIGAIHDQRNILLALATKSGVDAHKQDSEVVIWAS